MMKRNKKLFEGATLLKEINRRISSLSVTQALGAKVGTWRAISQAEGNGE